MNNKPIIRVEKIRLLNGDGPTKAFCDLIILDTFIAKGLKIVEGKDGLFLGMPREQGKDGKWYESVKPMSKEIRDALNETVINAFSE